MRRTVLACAIALAATGTATGVAVTRWPVTGPQQTRNAQPAAREHAVPLMPPVPPPGGPRRFDRTTLTKVVKSYLARRPGRAGVMVTDLGTNTSFGVGEHGRFVTASIMKVDILASLLLQRQRERRGLSAGERAMAAEMIRLSDNRAAYALYSAAGNGAGVARSNKRLGLRETEPYPTGWGSSKTTPADQVRLMKALVSPRSPLSAANRRHVLGLMGSVIGEQRWGISAAARPGERVAIKNGWVPLHVQGTGWAVNSVGRITAPGHDFLVAVCTQGHPSMESGVETVEHVADLAVSALRRAAPAG
ncbi:serine hydrolase [Spirillospora sp. NPDC029432]|uniref:serine hydrolase n=1 Tax=Spirillospora sp. NPDC029432 TaxID=3154599 RepID=UPI0034547BFB